MNGKLLIMSRGANHTPLIGQKQGFRGAFHYKSRGAADAYKYNNSRGINIIKH